MLYRAQSTGFPQAVLRRFDDFGIETLELVRPSGRFWAPPDETPSPVELNVDARRVDALRMPATLLSVVPINDTWIGAGRRALSRLHAWYLVYEDPQRRLDAQPVATLAHQASLVQHLLHEQNLTRVLIADEVGLGKTVEAGLLLKALLEKQPTLRILYLAPAKLVRNVRQEFDRLKLGFRIWVSGTDMDARLQDQKVIASIHRASHKSHFDAVINAGPWDVVVVDECHHLSDWARGGGKPVRKYKLVQELVECLKANGRVVLMSGTPHQGSPQRFENLLRFLRRDDEPDDAVAGRVIYRTKEDVADWDGHPLFPKRRVNPPLVLDLGALHRRWLENIYGLFESKGMDGTSSEGQAQRRAAGWRTNVALQWATSSVQAGLGFLVRQAIRAGWTQDHPALREALLALRPYRNGPDDELAEHVLQRIAKELRQQKQDADIEDIEDGEEQSDDETWKPDPTALAGTLIEGVVLLQQVGDAKWDFLYEKALRAAGDEKVVLFAQPIETVTALASYLRRKTGKMPALIIGNQSDAERELSMQSFWREDGPQFLVSSRAGGEGLNLQVARRLVHVDVPWNPMELEQRVGRVHRFKSRRTIIVDTIVVKDSREVDCYRIAREKLEEIARTLVPPDGFEGLFARVMALVPPEELQGLLNDGPLGPFSAEERDRMASLVVKGFNQWRKFDASYKDQRHRIASLDAGQASWADVERFALKNLSAKPAEGFSALKFRFADDEVVEHNEQASVLDIKGKFFACGDYGGMPITRSDGSPAERLGLNTQDVVRAMRDAAFPDQATGGAHLRWPATANLPGNLQARGLLGVLVFARQSIRSTQAFWLEAGVSMHIYFVDSEGQVTAVDDSAKGSVVRALLDSQVRVEPDPDSRPLADVLAVEETKLLQQLRRPTDDDRTQNTSHAVFPIFAAILNVGRP